jgi:hypothetical protein
MGSALARMVTRTTSGRRVRELDLSGCSLSSVDLDALLQALREGNHLRSLNLRHNQICEKGLEMLARVLETNDLLVSVDIRDNPGATGPLSARIYERLKRNMALLRISKLSSSAQTRNSRNSLEEAESSQPQAAEKGCLSCEGLRAELAEKDREIKYLKRELNLKMHQVS